MKNTKNCVEKYSIFMAISLNAEYIKNKDNF